VEKQNTPVGVMLTVASTIQTGFTGTTRCNVCRRGATPPRKATWHYSSRKPCPSSHDTYGRTQLNVSSEEQTCVAYLDLSPEKHTESILEAQGFIGYSAGSSAAAHTITGHKVLVV
jgi:hypothetical protein